ncbi:DUF2867 domain-containing protein [Streptomyces sp. NPDC050743]|uniref:DUF2867 domain-containing protein n=1 Tax=Streptomyces sp. NPDC050743 TaxID=3365634 RepID=UPI0037960FCA
MVRPRILSVPVPEDSLLQNLLSRVDYSDAFAVRLPSDAGVDAGEWADRFFAQPPSWVRRALALRDSLVGTLGLKTNDLEAAVPFPELLRTGREVVYGVDDRHLDFRASVHVARSDGAVQISVATVVHRHSLFGRLYFLPVRVVHPLIIRSMLRRLAA